MQMQIFKSESAFYQIIPYNKPDAAYYNQRGNGEDDEGVVIKARQGGKRRPGAHQVKARIAKCGHGMKHGKP
ncbi:hypothetical protein SDC9_98872 [bioreactor metagenome]|uniref:Uncharacterized protein n=1 Tax=bioreactor metagenome TaxID=1076179 RepID=A0A645AGN5_9ZZZZ